MKVKRLSRGVQYKGEVGIEVEVEGNQLPISPPTGWRKDVDGSLRGESAEFVLSRPCVRKSVDSYLTRLFDAYKESNTEVIPSNRQSIHIHINMQDVEVIQALNFITLSLIFEPIMVEYCGKERVNNRFCLESYNAEYLHQALSESFEKGSIYNLETDDLRYSFINVVSLFKYGSVEFRGMRGGVGKKTISDWVKVLLQLKDSALKFNTPADILNKFRDEPVDVFFEAILEDSTATLSPFFSERKMLESARSVKMMSLTSDWSKWPLEETEEIEEVEEEEAPSLSRYSIDPMPIPSEGSEDLSNILAELRSVYDVQSVIRFTQGDSNA